MGDVKQYEQGSLASQAVGVPEANLSGARALAGLANDFSNVENTVLDIAQTNVQQHNLQVAKQQQAIEALQKEQRKAVIAVSNDNRFTQLEALMNQQEENYLHQPIQDTNGNDLDPYARRQAFQEAYQKQFDSLAESITDPEEQADFLQRGSGRMMSGIGNFNSKMDTVQANMAVSETQKTLGTLIDTAGKASNIEQYQKAVASLDGMQNAMAWTLGEKASSTYETTKKSMAENFLWNLFDQDPNQMLAVIKTGVIDDSIPVKERVQFKQKWQTYALQRVKVQAQLAKIGVSANNIRAVNAAADMDGDGTVDPQELEAVYVQLKASGAPKYQTRTVKRAVMKAHNVDPDVTVGKSIPTAKGGSLFNIDKNVPANLQVNAQLNKSLGKVFGVDAETGEIVDDLGALTAAYKTKGGKKPTMADVEHLQQQIIYAQQHHMIQKQTASKWYNLTEVAASFLEGKGQMRAAVRNQKAKQYQAQVQQQKQQATQFINNMANIFGWKGSVIPSVNKKLQGNASESYAQIRQRFMKRNGGKPPNAKQDAQLRELAKGSAIRGHK